MSDDLTLEEKATNYETLTHIMHVRNLLNIAIQELIHRGEIHDQSKMGDLERSTFVEYTPKLKTSTYGSDEYKGFLAAMKPALDNHYASNRHHPEFFENGIEDMNLIDVLEMLLDWKAASERHNDGNIWKSIEVNQKRFGFSDETKFFLQNTIRDFGLGEGLDGDPKS
jgi:hypothetical protein